MKLSLGILCPAARCFLLGATLLSTLLLASGCTSGPGSASAYKNPTRSYVGPGYGAGPAGADTYATGVPSVAGQNTAAWYKNTRP